MKRTNKKGFTIVELVIVIAVIAILAAVLIPNISRLVKKAQISSDLSLVKNLNMALSIDSATMDYPTAYDAFEAVKENGYDLTKIEAKADKNKILYDSENKCFAYLNGSNVEYYPDSRKSKDMPAKHNLWAICTSAEEAEKSEYSVYWNGGSEALVINGVGFDAGDKSLTSVTYNGSASGRSVVVRTYGQMCELTVAAPNDHVEHYGFAKKTAVEAVNNSNSYHEYGTSSELIVTSGKIVIEAKGIVFSLKATSNATATVSNNGGNIMHSEVVGVSSSDIFYINSLEQFEAFRDATNAGVTFAEYNSDTRKIVLNTDITLTKAWKPISNFYRSYADYSTKWFAGYFDGNGHTIYGLTNENLSNESLNTGYDSTTPQGNTEYVYGLFASVNGATIKNLKLENVKIVSADSSNLKGDHVAALVGYANGDVQISDITVKGVIAGFDGTAGVIGGIRNTTSSGAKVKNCYNYATLTSVRRSAGIVGNINTTGKIEIADCTNYGSITIDNKADEVQNVAAGIALTAIPNTDNYDVNVSFVNCKIGANVALTGTDKTRIAKVTVIYSTQYNYNSNGNILNNNQGQTVVDNHIVEEDNCGTLTATISKESNNNTICTWNWNE